MGLTGLDGTGAWRSWGRFVAPAVAFVIPLAAFVSVQQGRVFSYDGLDMRGVALAILHGRLSLTHPPAPNLKGQAYSPYGIGVSLVVIPLYAIQRLAGLHRDWLVTLADPLLLAATSLVLYATARSLSWSRKAGVLVALIFATLTMAWQMSQELLSEPGVALGISLVVLGVVRWRSAATCGHRQVSEETAGGAAVSSDTRVSGAGGDRSGPWLIGAGLAVSLLFRSDSAVLVWPAVLLLPAFVPIRRLARDRRALAGVVVPAAAALGWSMYYSLVSSGSVIPRNYGGSKAGTWITPFWTGMNGLLLSHGKGFFTYNPFLLLAIPGAVLMWRRDRALTLLLVGFLLVRALFYARFWSWSGDSAWGPRYLMPATAPLSLLAGYSLAWLPRLRSRLRIPAVVAVSLLGVTALGVNVAGVWIGFGRSRPHIKIPAGLTPLQGFRYATSRLHDYFYSFAHGNLGWAFSHWTTPTAGFLPHWQHGPDAVAVGTVVVCLAAGVMFVVSERAGRGAGPAQLSPGSRAAPGSGSGAAASTASAPRSGGSAPS